MNNEERLGTESIPKLFFSLSIPAIITMAVSFLYSIVDIIYIGKGIGTIAVGAVTLIFPLLQINNAISALIGAGSSSLLSIRFGENNHKEMNKIVANACLLTIIWGLLYSILGLSALTPILRLLGATEGILSYAKDYMVFIFVGMLYYPLTIVSDYLMNGEGNSKSSMIISTIETICNIILTPIFIFIFKMGIKGASLGTIISQFIALVLIISYYKSNKTNVRLKYSDFLPRFKIIKDIVKIGFPKFTTRITEALMSIILNYSLLYYGGELAISSYGIMTILYNVLSFPLIGFAEGLQPIIGYNYGSKNVYRVKEAINFALKVSFATGVVITALFFMFPQQILNIFTNDVDLIAYSLPQARMVVSSITVMGISLISYMLYISIGKPLPPFILAFVKTLVLYIPLFIFLPMSLSNGIWGIWLTFPICEFIVAGVDFILIKVGIKKYLNNLK